MKKDQKTTVRWNIFVKATETQSLWIKIQIRRSQRFWKLWKINFHKRFRKDSFRSVNKISQFSFLKQGACQVVDSRNKSKNDNFI